MLDWFTDTSVLTPHGFCLFWEPGLLWLDAASDAVTMLAYYSIPIALIWFMRRRPDLPHRWVATLFASFILACGTAHGLAILTLWVPAYHLEASVKLLTAGLSITTAVTLWWIMPAALALPTAAGMAALNLALRRANERLELRVAERTAELVITNEIISRNEARIRQVVEAAPNAMIMTSADGAIEMINTQTERMFGYARDELIGRPVEMLVPPQARERHPDLCAKFFTRPRARPMGAATPLTAVRKDGTPFEVEIGLNPIETDEGLKVLSAIVDISGRIRIEAQLRHSQKMEAIGRVTAGVAHDFNNLLQALGGSLELLLDAVADDPVAVEWGNVALRAATRGGELTGRLLAFSRQQILSAQAVPVGKLLADVERLTSHFFETNTTARINLVVAPTPPGIAVMADPGQLEAALINLVVNARDAMANGGCLRISAFEAAADPAIVPPGRYAVISVEDTGSGMSAETLAQAFEPFFTTKGVGGTGLGLSMVQGFARQSGGEAHVVSVVGEGTTVELWLPSASIGSHADVAARPPGVARGRVLLVDDSPDVLLIVGSFLRHAGLEVTSVTSGDRALAELTAGKRFDVIVTDFAMPGMNGLDFLVRARAIDRAVVGIVITGFTEPALLPELTNVVVLRKPFNRAELIAKVNELLEFGQLA